MQGFVAKVASIVLATLALATASTLIVNQFRTRDARERQPAPAPLAPPQSSSEGDISFLAPRQE